MKKRTYILSRDVLNSHQHQGEKYNLLFWWMHHNHKIINVSNRPVSWYPSHTKNARTIWKTVGQHPCKPFQAWVYDSHLHPPQAANCCRHFRLVVNEDDLCGLKIEENYHVLVNHFDGNFRIKTLGLRKIKTVFRNVKWCFNASWGLKGLTGV